MSDIKEKLVELLTDCKAKGFWSYGTDSKTGEHGGHEMTAEDIADYLAENIASKWISVNDRTPTEKGCYMVTVKHWLDGKPVAREAKWNGVDWLSCYKAEELTPRVTHWQPMPQPPKGE